eukprot:1567148-Lingulodinium_polyedra.AAC.1
MALGRRVRRRLGRDELWFAAHARSRAKNLGVDWAAATAVRRHVLRARVAHLRRRLGRIRPIRRTRKGGRY